MSTNLPSTDVQILHSWKEISSYTGRGVRTLQRYETNFRFPIHRPLGKPRSSVLAFKHEIDAWMAKTPVACAGDSPDSYATQAEMPPRNITGPLAALSTSTARWNCQTSSMQQGFASMQQALNSMQEKLNSVLQRLERMQTSATRTRLLWEQVQSRRERLRTGTGITSSREETRGGVWQLGNLSMTSSRQSGLSVRVQSNSVSELP